MVLHLESLLPLLELEIGHAADTKVANHCLLIIEVDVFTLQVLVNDTPVVKVT